MAGPGAGCICISMAFLHGSSLIFSRLVQHATILNRPVAQARNVLGVAILVGIFRELCVSVAWFDESSSKLQYHEMVR